MYPSTEFNDDIKNLSRGSLMGAPQSLAVLSSRIVPLRERSNNVCLTKWVRAA